MDIEPIIKEDENHDKIKIQPAQQEVKQEATVKIEGQPM